ncbi:MAG: hypothetical protein L0H94_13970 [Nitrospira sp.]|nr:hypothetical protein [Nitrospira sp.]
MALPVICPECGIHNPPENRWCECGYDLDRILQDTPLPIKKHLVKPSLASSDDANVVPEEALQGGATPKLETFRKSYIRRHWQGELPLGQSYWVNTVLLSFLFQVPWYGVKGNYFDAWITASPRIVGGFFVIYLVLLLVITIWQYVGLWRSARSHIAKTKRSFWARTTQIIVVIGVIASVNVFIGTAWPQIKEFSQIVFGFGDYGGFTVRVIRQGKEIEVIGGMAFGLTEEVKRQLDANPEVRVIHLNSIGGRIAEARVLRQLIQTRNLITYSSRGCQSACASAFMGGQIRILNRNARLGFHQPSFAGLTPAQIENEIEEERKYFLSRGVDTAFVQKAFSTPNKEMWTPSPEELLAARVIRQISDGAQFAMTETGLRSNVDDLEKVLLTIPLYQSIKKHDPETFEQIMSGIAKSFKGDASKEEMVALMREKTSTLYLRYLPISDDDALLNAIRKTIDALSVMEKSNLEACYAFLYGGSYIDFMGLLSKDMQAALLDSMAGVIETGVSNPQAIPGEKQVARQRELVTGALTRRYGDDVALLSDPSAPGVDKAKICSMSVELYRQVLKLPKKESIQLLRFMAATGQSNGG